MRYQIYCETGGGSFDVKEKFDWHDHSVLSDISHTGGVRALLEAAAGLENRAGVNPVRRVWGVCASGFVGENRKCFRERML